MSWAESGQRQHAVIDRVMDRRGGCEVSLYRHWLTPVAGTFAQRCTLHLFECVSAFLVSYCGVSGTTVT
jgi:hypothetical protein